MLEARVAGLFGGRSSEESRTARPSFWNSPTFLSLSKNPVDMSTSHVLRSIVIKVRHMKSGRLLADLVIAPCSIAHSASAATELRLGLFGFDDHV